MVAGASRTGIWAFALTAAVVGLTLAGLHPIYNNDTFGHLGQGRQIAELGRIPESDTFSFWPDKPARWTNYEWGSDLLFWTAFDVGGPNGLLALKLLLLGATAGLVVLYGRRLSAANGLVGAVMTSLLVLIAIPGVRFRLSARPHLIGWLLASLYLVGLHALSSEEEGHPRRTVAGWMAGLTGAHLLWVNLHGSHLLGLGLTTAHGLFVRSKRTRTRMVVLVAMQLAVSCLSPYGPAILTDAIVHSLHPAYRATVGEWGAWSVGDPLWYLAAPVVQTLLLAAVTPAMWRLQGRGRAALLSALALAVLAFRSRRFVAPYLLLTAPMVAAGLSVYLQRWPPRHVLRVAIAAVLAAGVGAAPAAAALPPHLGLGTGLDLRYVPAAAGQVLQRHVPQARVLAAPEDAWFLFFGTPSAKFLVDGRIPFYGPEPIQKVTGALGNPDALRELLARHPIDSVILNFTHGTHQPAIRTLRQLGSWHMASLEDHHVLFVHHQRDVLALDALQATYRPHPWLRDPLDISGVEKELRLLERRRNTLGYRSWVGGLLALRPLRREGAAAGFHPPRNARQTAAAERALEQLTQAAHRLPLIPTAHVYRALAAIAACELETANSSLRRARAQGRNRETVLAKMELRLRQGETRPVQRFLQRARDNGRTRHDPWVAALRQASERDLRCPSGN